MRFWGKRAMPMLFRRGLRLQTKNILPHVHMIVSLLKRWLLGTHQGAVEEVHLQAYLDGYVFRFNRRKSNKWGLLLCRLLECAMQVPPTTLKDLLGG